jgi:hypothetical protein
MAAHNEWIAKGFADGVFLGRRLADAGSGRRNPCTRGSREDHEARVATDPFIVHGIVAAEIYEVDPKRTTEALNFLIAPA